MRETYGMKKPEVVWETDWSEILTMEHCALISKGIRCKKRPTPEDARAAERRANESLQAARCDSIQIL